MKFLTGIINLLNQHKDSLSKVADNVANGNLMKVAMQLGRLRTAEEQRALLHTYYVETIEELKELDDSGYVQLPLVTDFIAQGELSVEQLENFAEEFSGFVGITGQLDTIDFGAIEHLPLNAIPKEHEAHTILSNYKHYMAKERFLERIKELMDLLEQEGHKEEKLTADEVQEVKSDKGFSLTAAQKVLALYYLMRRAGIELGERQGARHQRFIVALTGIAAGAVKEKFPSASVASKPYYIENLKAIVPLFESVNATALVERIQSAIQFEQEERDLT